MKLYIIRHGELDKKFQGKLVGHIDAALSKKGKDQAHKLGKFFYQTKIDLIYTSDLQRTSDTAQIIAAYTNSEVKQSEMLREISFGQWEEKLISELPACQAGESTHAPDGEFYMDFVKRVTAFAKELGKDQKNQTICIVAHAGVNRELIRYFCQYPLSVFIEQTVGCINCIEVMDGETVLKFLNKTV